MSLVKLGLYLKIELPAAPREFLQYYVVSIMVDSVVSHSVPGPDYSVLLWQLLPKDSVLFAV